MTTTNTTTINGTATPITCSDTNKCQRFKDWFAKVQSRIASIKVAYHDKDISRRILGFCIRTCRFIARLVSRTFTFLTKLGIIVLVLIAIYEFSAAHPDVVANITETAKEVFTNTSEAIRNVFVNIAEMIRNTFDNAFSSLGL